MTDKLCTRCRRWQNVGNFSKQSRSRDGLQSWCKDCNRDVWAATAKQKSELRKNDRKRLSEYDRMYRKANLSKKRAQDAKRRSLKKLLPGSLVVLFEIALRDGATCWMCGDELSEWNPAHLDHLVPLSASAELLEAWNLSNPGTVRANMALACPTCNMRKSNRVMPCALARYFRNLSAESEIAA